MKQIITAEKSQKIRRGDFNIDINFPGLAVNDISEPRGFGQLGRFDHGRLHPGVFVGMHPHVNDEILSYLRKGNLIHEDTEGEKTIINNTKLMMMNAGKGIYHQESIPEDGEAVEMLQIFMRPSQIDSKPSVQFYDFPEAFSKNQWRLIAGPAESEAPLTINSDIAVYDTHLTNTSINLPGKKGRSYVLYLFEGKLRTDTVEMKQGDMLIFENEKIHVRTKDHADLVLFEINRHTTYTRKGMYSGV